MKTIKVLLVVTLVIVADLAVVLLIMGSLWVERSLGWSQGIILDAMTVVAVSYVALGWCGEKFLEWELREKAPDSSPALIPDSPEHKELHQAR